MITTFKIVAAGVLALMPLSATAEPTQLKLSFFGPEQTQTYQYGIKPFVDAVNTEGKGLVAINVYFDGALGKSQGQQPQLVVDGVADIAFVVPGATPYRFPDNDLIEQPGLFRNTREGTLVYTRLVAANALRGYQEFVVIGAYTPDPIFIHSRKPIETLASLKAQKISVNNPVAAAALERLGAMPAVLDMRQLADAIDRGIIDGAALSPTGLLQFGVSKLATNHYLLGIGTAPLALLMSRKTFDALPEAAKVIIRKYSGEWTAANWIASFGAAEQQFLQKLKSDPGRRVIEPSPSDLDAAQKIYRFMIAGWSEQSAHNKEILKIAQSELVLIRSDK